MPITPEEELLREAKELINATPCSPEDLQQGFGSITEVIEIMIKYCCQPAQNCENGLMPCCNYYGIIVSVNGANAMGFQTFTVNIYDFSGDFVTQVDDAFSWQECEFVVGEIVGVFTDPNCLVAIMADSCDENHQCCSSGSLPSGSGSSSGPSVPPGSSSSTPPGSSSGPPTPSSSGSSSTDPQEGCLCLDAVTHTWCHYEEKTTGGSIPQSSITEVTRPAIISGGSYYYNANAPSSEIFNYGRWRGRGYEQPNPSDYDLKVSMGSSCDPNVGPPKTFTLFGGTAIDLTWNQPGGVQDYQDSNGAIAERAVNLYQIGNGGVVRHPWDGLSQEVVDNEAADCYPSRHALCGTRKTKPKGTLVIGGMCTGDPFETIVRYNDNGYFYGFSAFCQSPSEPYEPGRATYKVGGLQDNVVFHDGCLPAIPDADTDDAYQPRLACSISFNFSCNGFVYWDSSGFQTGKSSAEGDIVRQLWRRNWQPPFPPPVTWNPNSNTSSGTFEIYWEKITRGPVVNGSPTFVTTSGTVAVPWSLTIS